MRIYLTGAVGAEHGTPLSRDQLAEEVWNGSPPDRWEVAVRALVSKVRALLAPVVWTPPAPRRWSPA